LLSLFPLMISFTVSLLFSIGLPFAHSFFANLALMLWITINKITNFLITSTQISVSAKVGY
jgi:hypothetical protein